jgi:hypothetical protein
MLNKNPLASLATQSRETVQSLITYHNHGIPPAEMPPFYRLTADMVIVASSKGDVYYMTTPRSCTCPSATYRPGRLCKHSLRYFPESMRKAATDRQHSPASQVEEAGSIRPAANWAGGLNGPFSLLQSEEKASGVA